MPFFHSRPNVSPSQVIATEWLLLLVASALAIIAAGALIRRAKRLDGILARLAMQRRLAISMVVLFPVVLRLTLLPVMPPPSIQVEEEGANLLQADTLRHFRLANPPLQHWQSFDAPQVLQRPYYVSSRPPGLSLFLAAGQLLFGNPWAGVCLSIAFMCASAWWMLGGWFAPKWAVYGGLLLGIRLGVLTYWMNSFWGGAACTAGASLVMGAYPRLVRKARPSSIAALCAGLALLMLTRTYEGGLLLLPVGFLLLREAWRKSSGGDAKWAKVVLGPTVCFVMLLTAWFGYYNWRTTDSPFTSPYALGRQAQSPTSPFIFGKLQPLPPYSNEQMRVRFAEWEVSSHEYLTHWEGWKFGQEQKLLTYWTFYIRPTLTVPLILGLLCWRCRGVCFCALILFVMYCGSMLEVWAPSYYFAPSLPALLVLIVQGIRYGQTAKISGKRSGRLLPHMVLALAIIVFSWLAAIRVLGGHIEGEGVLQWCGYENRMPRREEVRRMIQSQPGKHLVFVRYTPGHNSLCEWVYNEADLASARIVWAHDAGEKANREVSAEFPDRRVWVIGAQ